MTSEKAAQEKSTKHNTNNENANSMEKEQVRGKVVEGHNNEKKKHDGTFMFSTELKRLIRRQGLLGTHNP